MISEILFWTFCVIISLPFDLTKAILFNISIIVPALIIISLQLLIFSIPAYLARSFRNLGYFFWLLVKLLCLKVHIYITKCCASKNQVPPDLDNEEEHADSELCLPIELVDPRILEEFFDIIEESECDVTETSPDISLMKEETSLDIHIHLPMETVVNEISDDSDSANAMVTSSVDGSAMEISECNKNPISAIVADLPMEISYEDDKPIETSTDAAPTIEISDEDHQRIERFIFGDLSMEISDDNNIPMISSIVDGSAMDISDDNNIPMISSIVDGSAMDISDDNNSQMVDGSVKEISDDDNSLMVGGSVMEISDETDKPLLTSVVGGSAMEISDDNNSLMVDGLVMEISDDTNKPLLTSVVGGSAMEISDDNNSLMVYGSVMEISDDNYKYMETSAADKNTPMEISSDNNKQLDTTMVQRDQNDKPLVTLPLNGRLMDDKSMELPMETTDDNEHFIIPTVYNIPMEISHNDATQFDTEMVTPEENDTPMDTTTLKESSPINSFETAIVSSVANDIPVDIITQASSVDIQVNISQALDTPVCTTTADDIPVNIQHAGTPLGITSAAHTTFINSTKFAYEKIYTSPVTETLVDFLQTAETPLGVLPNTITSAITLQAADSLAVSSQAAHQSIFTSPGVKSSLHHPFADQTLSNSLQMQNKGISSPLADSSANTLNEKQNTLSTYSQSETMTSDGTVLQYEVTANHNINQADRSGNLENSAPERSESVEIENSYSRVNKESDREHQDHLVDPVIEDSLLSSYKMADYLTDITASYPKADTPDIVPPTLSSQIVEQLDTLKDDSESDTAKESADDDKRAALPDPLSKIPSSYSYEIIAPFPTADKPAQKLDTAPDIPYQADGKVSVLSENSLKPINEHCQKVIYDDEKQHYKVEEFSAILPTDLANIYVADDAAFVVDQTLDDCNMDQPLRCESSNVITPGPSMTSAWKLKKDGSSVDADNTKLMAGTSMTSGYGMFADGISDVRDQAEISNCETSPSPWKAVSQDSGLRGDGFLKFLAKKEILLPLLVFGISAGILYKRYCR